MTEALLIIAAWTALAFIIVGAWCGTIAWYGARVARRQRRGGYVNER